MSDGVASKTLTSSANRSEEEAKAETYRYWHSRPVGEVFDAIAEMSREAWENCYALNGGPPRIEGHPRALIRVPRKFGTEN